MGIDAPRIPDYGKPLKVCAAHADVNALPPASTSGIRPSEDIADWLRDCVDGSAYVTAETTLRNLTHPGSPSLARLDSFARLAESCGVTQRDHFGVSLHRHPMPIDLFIGDERAGARVVVQLPPAAHEVRLMASVERALSQELSRQAWDRPAALVNSATATRAQCSVLKALANPCVGQVLTEVTGTVPAAAALAAIGNATVMTAFEQRVEQRSLPNDYLVATVRVGARAPDVPEAVQALFAQGLQQLEQLQEEVQTRMQLIAELSRQLRNIGPYAVPSFTPEQQATRQLINDQQDWLTRAMAAAGMVRAQMAFQANQLAANVHDGYSNIDASVTFLIAPDGTLRCVHAWGCARPVVSCAVSHTRSEQHAGAADGQVTGAGEKSGLTSRVWA